MDVNYDYSADRFSVGEVDYSLFDLRLYLTTKHPELVRGHFIRTIMSKGKAKMTFDWQTVYFKAEQYSIIKNFIDDISRTSK